MQRLSETKRGFRFNPTKKESDKVAPRQAMMLFVSFLSNDFLALVVAALGANHMAFDKFVALRALYKTGSGELPVGKTGIRFGFGDFIFR